jgi:hypothetical protein
VVEGVEEYRGYEAAMLRASLERLDAESRRQGLEKLLSRSFHGPSLTALQVDGERDPEVPLVLRWSARVSEWVRLEPGRAVADTPLFPARLGARFLQRASRETQVFVASDERSALDVTVLLPRDWVAVPGAGAELDGAYGSYVRQERLEAGTLRRVDRQDLRRGRIAPSEYAAFAAFARAVDGAQDQPMTFRRGGILAAPARPRSAPQLPSGAREEPLRNGAVQVEPTAREHQATPHVDREAPADEGRHLLPRRDGQLREGQPAPRS